MIQQIINRIQNSDIGKRIVNGAFWSFSGTAIAKLVVLVSSIICAHILTKAQYGEFGIVRSTINMFVVFGEAGLGLTATKYISEFRKTDRDHISSIYVLTNLFAVITGIIACSLLIIFSSTIAANALHAPHLEPSVKIGAVMLFVAVINGAQLGVLSGFENFKSIAINTLFGSISEAIFMLLGAYLYGVTGAVLGFGVGFIVLLILNQAAIKKLFRKNGLFVSINSLRKSDVSLLYKFSLPAALSSILIAPTYWVIKTMLVDINGFEELASFEAADQWRVIALFIPSAISQIVLPILSSIVNVDKQKFWKVLWYNIMLNGTISLIIALIIIVFRGIIMNTYGSSYDNVSVLSFLALSTIFSSVANVVGMSIASRSKMWEGFLFNLAWAAMVIGFSYILLKMSYGATGIAIALLCAYIIHSVLQLLYLALIVKK